MIFRVMFFRVMLLIKSPIVFDYRAFDYLKRDVFILLLLFLPQESEQNFMRAPSQTQPHSLQIILSILLLY